MGEWRTVPFQELAATEPRSFAIGPFGSAITKDNYRSQGIPVVRGVNLARGRFVDTGFVYISDEKADQLHAANLHPGDLVFTHRGTIGQVSMIPRDPLHKRYVLSSSQVKARLDNRKALPEYYYYWFTSPPGQHLLLANSSTVGVPGIGQPLATIKALEVPFPPLTVQKSIAAVLGALDDKIAVNERIESTTEQLLGARFEQLGIDVEPNGNVPLVTSDLVEFNPRLKAPSCDMAVYLDMAALPTSTAQIGTWSRRPPKSGTKFANGDTVMARITPCLENGKAGFIDFMDDNEVGVGSTEFIVMRSRGGVPRQVPYFLARSSRFRSIAIQNMVGSSGRQRVSAARLESVPLTKPDERELQAFGEAASKAFEHMKSLGQESRVLAQLRDTLLPKLMSGELRVRDAERVVEDAT